jgi:hypothetical protein
MLVTRPAALSLSVFVAVSAPNVAVAARAPGITRSDGDASAERPPRARARDDRQRADGVTRTAGT